MVPKNCSKTEQEEAKIKIIVKDLFNVMDNYIQEVFLKKKERKVFLNLCQKEADEEDARGIEAFKRIHQSIFHTWKAWKYGF